jgi:predicted alpha/beta-fold hydrolase
MHYAFTQQGVAMLSSVLRSPHVVEVNNAIMRTFVQLRRLMDSNQLLTCGLLSEPINPGIVHILPAQYAHSRFRFSTAALAAQRTPAASRYPRIALIGFSLGGNLTLKYLGEVSPNPAVIAAVAISVPVDLAATARRLDRGWSNGIYRRRFIKSLMAKVEIKARRFPDNFDMSRSRLIETFREFDDRYTAPIHGFRDAADYWQKSSARQYLHRITTPTLLLHACDDPFLTPESFPFAEAERNPSLFFEVPESGGHLGFIDLARGIEPWFERRVVEFLVAT